MMESQPQSSGEMEVEQIMCDLCRKEGETNVGLKLCLGCKDVLCEECIRYHKRFKATKDHTLIDVTETSKTRLIDFITGAGQCHVHAERDKDIYCKTHDTLTCALCFIADHKTCEMTEIASHNIDVTKLQTDSEILMSQMKAAIEHIDHLQKLRVEIKINLKQKLKDVRESIKQVRDKVVELMDNVVSYVRDVTKQIEIEREDRLDAEIARVTTIKDITEQNITLLETIGQHGSEKHKFVSVHVMKSQVDEISKHISEEDTNIKQFDAKLVIADQLKKLTENTDLEKLVHIKANESESSHTPFTSVSTPLIDNGTISMHAEATETDQKSIARSVESMPATLKYTEDTRNVLRDSKLVKVQEHIVYSDDEYPPRYYGISVYWDGRFIISYHSNDFANGYLCLCNPASQSVLKLNMAGNSCSAVEIGDSRLAVSSPNNRVIRIVTVGDALRVEKKLKTRNRPGNMVVLNNCQLAVAWRDPPAFGVIDVRGEIVIQRLYLDQDTSERKFKSFDYLAVDERRQHVIQACYQSKAVYCFKFTGQPVFMYANQGLKNPQGVALDKCGNIYVCECNSPGSIHKLSPTGDLIRVITEGVPPGPLAICSDVTGTGFLVTQLPLTIGQLRSGHSRTVVYFKFK